MTMLKVLQRLEHAYTPHGFRSTFRTWISEKTNHVHEVAEAALAHTIGDKVVAAYQRGICRKTAPTHAGLGRLYK